jgi:hypothetical protein
MIVYPAAVGMVHLAPGVIHCSAPLHPACQHTAAQALPPATTAFAVIVRNLHQILHQAFLIDGMESLSQAKVGSALQVFFNLEQLQQVRQQQQQQQQQRNPVVACTAGEPAAAAHPDA